MRNPLRTGQPKKAYKLRDTKTGLYSNGGYYGSWGPDGKTWSTLGNLKSHLRLRYGRGHYDTEQRKYVKTLSIPAELEIVEGIFQPQGESIGPAKDLFNE